MSGIGWRPRWAAPPPVRALMTTRAGGTSAGPWGLHDARAGGLNLGMHCGDDPAAVRRNRARLCAALPAAPAWLRQVHGAAVADADARGPVQDAAVADANVHEQADEPQADASVARRPGSVCVVLVADCLPVLLAARDASVVAAAHAGWRGLAGGVLEATVGAMRARAGSATGIVAWLGPCIGPGAFEVGAEVRERFCDADVLAGEAFRPAARPGKWLADLPALARQRLVRAGVTQVAGGRWCTVADARRFYSFRRDGVTGRMAACVWIDPAGGAAGARDAAVSVGAAAGGPGAAGG